MQRHDGTRPGSIGSGEATTVKVTTVEETPRRPRRPRRSTVALLVSAIGFGFSPFFATRAFDAGVDPVAASLLRISLLAVATAPFVGGLRRCGRQACVVFAGGAASMLGFAGYFVALDRAPVAAATVVYYTYPLVVLVVSAMLWKHRLRVRDAASAVAILAGVVVCVGPAAIDGEAFVALLPAFAAPLGWGIYLIVLSGPAAEMPLGPKMLAGSLGGVVALAPLAIVRTGGHLMPVTWEAGWAVALLTVCTLAVPAVMVTWGAARASREATSMIGSLEFVIALGVSWTLMGGQPSWTKVVGAGLVCAAATSQMRQPPERAITAPSSGTEVSVSSDARRSSSSHP